MVGWHHRLDGQFEQARGVGEGQGSLARYSPWGHEESDMTERLNLADSYEFLVTKCCIRVGRFQKGDKIKATVSDRNSRIQSKLSIRVLNIY